MNDRLQTVVLAIRQSPARSIAGVALFAGAIMLSAGLIFSIEPMIAKMLLPHFGGSAAVWSVALVFFQCALLAGYLYAHLSVRYLPLRAGKVLHLLLLAAALPFLPPGLPADPAPSEGADEVWTLLRTLAASVGVPFAVLSANAPLLQAWFARSDLPGRDNPYPLYAASNIGSIGALLAYPFVIEPLTRLRDQALGWSVGFGALLAAIALAAVFSSSGRARSEASTGSQPTAGITDLAGWLFLSLVPSAALVAVTAHISTDVAAAPFLWALPLALYLVSFVVAFGGMPAPLLTLLLRAMPLALIGLAAVLAFGMRINALVDVALHAGMFFLLCVVLHGLLARRRPPTALLTTFYLAMSFGGVIGGILAALAAPVVFSSVAEYPLVLAFAALALPTGRLVALAGMAVIGTLAVFGPFDSRERETHRSFYGVHTIETTGDGQFRTLRHGAEIHGAQRLRDEAGRPATGKPEPLTYYSEDSPISEAIDAMREKKAGGPLRIGVIGLGTGSIACLAEPSDALTFFEIDPEVVAIARNRTKFAFLSACAPKARIILGDARQRLAAEEGAFDLLIVDAFSSDSIPVHLLTREALALYAGRLAADGAILLHISNNHLRLNEVVAATARSLDLAVRINDEDEPEEPAAMVIQPTVAILARKDSDFGALAASEDWAVPEPSPRIRAWTDDYSNLLGAFLNRLRKD